MNINHLSSLKFNVLTSAARRPSAELMAQSLRSKGVVIADAEVAAIGGDVKRLNALHQLDFAGGKTAFEHIESLAAAGTIRDGSPSAPLAADLFSLAGSVRNAMYGKCYARTNHSVYTTNHAGEMSRIVGELAARGEVTLTDGTLVKWNHATFPAGTSTVDRLWGALNHYLKAKELPANQELYELEEYASKGQMANITSRLMGEQFVNVDGSKALPHLTGITDSYGPMLAEFSSHGGAVAEVTPDGAVKTQDGGNAVLTRRSNIGYVVVPAQVAKEKGIPVIEYLESEPQGYAKPPAVPVADDVKKTES